MRPRKQNTQDDLYDDFLEDEQIREEVAELDPEASGECYEPYDPNWEDNEPDPEDLAWMNEPIPPEAVESLDVNTLDQLPDLE